MYIYAILESFNDGFPRARAHTHTERERARERSKRLSETRRAHTFSSSFSSSMNICRTLHILILFLKFSQYIQVYMK